MVLPFHITDNQSSQHPSCLFSKHRDMSRRSVEINGKMLLHKYLHYRKQRIISWRTKELKAFMDEWGKVKIESDLLYKEIGATERPTFWWNLEVVISKLQNTNYHHGLPKRHRCITQYTDVSLNKLLTQDPWQQ